MVVPVNRSDLAVPDPTARSRTAWIVVGVLAVVAFGVLAVWESSGDPASTVCGLRRIAGVDCPTCGMTRAAAALARGRIAEATRLHPLCVPLALEGAVLWLAWGWVVWRRARPPSGPWIVGLVVANVVVFVVVWLLRM